MAVNSEANYSEANYSEANYSEAPRVSGVPVKLLDQDSNLEPGG